MHGFASSYKFGNALGVKSTELADGGFGNHQACGIDTEIVSTVDVAWQPVHQNAVAFGGSNIEHNVPVRPIHVTGPVIVRQHWLAVFGVTACGHKGAATLWNRGFHCIWGALLLVIKRNVIGSCFKRCVHCYKVPHVQLLNTVCLHPGQYALQLIAIFFLNFWPQHFSRGLAEEGPILVGIVH